MSQIEGLWTAEIGSLGGWSVGGCRDIRTRAFVWRRDQHYFVGRYELKGRVLTAEARSFHFHGPALNAFGDIAPDFRIAIKGRLVADFIDGEIERIDPPGATLPFRLIWRSALG